MQDKNLFRDDFEPIDRIADRLVQEARSRANRPVEPDPSPEPRKASLSPFRLTLALHRARLRAKRWG